MDMFLSIGGGNPQTLQQAQSMAASRNPMEQFAELCGLCDSSPEGRFNVREIR